MLDWLRRHPLSGYIIIAYGITAAVITPLILSKRGIIDLSLPHHYESLGAFGPFIAALWLGYLLGGKAAIGRFFRGLVDWRVSPKWFLITLLSPVGLFFLAAALVKAQTGSWPDYSVIGDSKLMTLTGIIDLALFGALIQSLGEEPGWRGFFLERLRQRYRPLLASMILAPLWIAWHIPSFLTRPEFGLPQLLGLGSGLIAAAVWLTFIYDATRNVLMAILWHTMINIVRGTALIISTPFFLAIGGAVILTALIIIAYWLFSKPEVYPPTVESS